jgi:D-3-phosphoglycerate dehydrogenase
VEVKSTEPIDYAELLVLRAFADNDAASVAGTFYGSLTNPRIVRINDMPIEAVPEGVVFVIHNTDRPGIIGWVGTVIGKHRINIANMFLGRDQVGGRALTVLNLDSDPSPGLIEELRENPEVLDVTVANL